VMDWFHLSREQVLAVLEFTCGALTAPAGMQPPTPAVDAHTPSITVPPLALRYALKVMSSWKLSNADGTGLLTAN